MTLLGVVIPLFVACSLALILTGLIYSHLTMCREKTLRPLLLLIGSLLLFIVQSDAAPPAGYVLVWSDEFEGTFLNTNKWEHRLPGPRNDAINTSNAVSLSNGVLTITTYTEGGTNFTGMIAPWGHRIGCGGAKST